MLTMLRMQIITPIAINARSAIITSIPNDPASWPSPTIIGPITKDVPLIIPSIHLEKLGGALLLFTVFIFIQLLAR